MPQNSSDTSRIAVMAIIVDSPEAVETLNATLHAYAPYIVGRMGIPYHKRKVNIISVALDAPEPTISALAGKIGAISGISVRTAYSNLH